MDKRVMPSTVSEVQKRDSSGLGESTSDDIGTFTLRAFVERAISKRDNEHYAVKDEKDDDYEVWDYGVSRRRGWLLAGTWLLASVVE